MAICKNEIKKILYINLAFMGDVIIATPAIRALRKKYPEAIIDMLVTPWAGQVAVGNPYVDHVNLYDKKGKHKNIFELYKLIKNLRRKKYDLAISSNFAIRGALVAFFSGIPYRIGYDTRNAGLFLTHTVSAKRETVKHETENQLEILKPLDITTDDTSLEYRLNQVDIDFIKNKFTNKDKKYRIAICPYGRHPLNSWTDVGYVDVINQLNSLAECFLIGGKNEEISLEKLNTLSENKATILAGTLTMSQLAAFIATCDLMITVDTGPMHIAGAIGTPILALFGRSDPRVWGPCGKYDVVIRSDLECVPCIMPRQCTHHSCMKNITATSVVHTAEEILSKSKGEAEL